LAGILVDITIDFEGGSSAPAFIVALIEIAFVGTQLASVNAERPRLAGIEKSASPARAARLSLKD
tara:strand:+ start:7727 stop:7921 length:195 start_codon:yes stop_codon:yes gene_type:complete